jgi:peptide/nickel transport system ATP-binding protein
MYLGQIVEVAPRDQLFKRPRHPYTRVLLAASMVEDNADHEVLAQLQGEPPSPIDPPSGCRFHPRCPLAQDICRVELTEVSVVGDDHTVTCHFWDA